MTDETSPIDDDASADVLEDAQQAIADARRRLAEVPAHVVVTNHAMGLYELAAIHLSTSPPDLASATLAIDALGALVEGLGDRLGPEAPTLRDALANIRVAFVQVKKAQTDAGAASANGADRGAAADGDATADGDPSADDTAAGDAG